MMQWSVEPPRRILPAEPDPRSAGQRPARYRYGAVLVLTVVLLIFLIAAPTSDVTRAVTVALELSMIVVIVATSRARAEIRRSRTLALAVPGALLVAGIATGVLPVLSALLTAAVLSAVVPAALVSGLLRLIRDRGVTAQAVAGALAIYVLVGLLFASVIAVLAYTINGPFFAQGSDGTTSERVYFSLATLTTTGYGDLTAGQAAGRALAVTEMLVGQLYLVTVIGVLVGSLASRARSTQGD